MNNDTKLATIYRIASEELHKHGLDLKGWKFEFDRAKRRLGCCNFTKKTITVSRYSAIEHSIDKVIDTVLHEIAHALVGPENNHNHIWKVKAREIGAPTETTADIKIRNIIPKYIAVCSQCGKSFRAYRRKKYMNHPNVFYKCGFCKNRIDYKLNPEWNKQQKCEV